MHGGFHVCLAHHQRIGATHERLHFRGHRAKLAKLAEDRAVRIAQDAESRLVVHPHLGAGPGALEIVFAVAQECEMVIVRPLQELLCLRDVTRATFGDAPLEIGNHRLYLAAHRRPVLDRRAHVGIDAGQCRPDFLKTLLA